METTGETKRLTYSVNQKMTVGGIPCFIFFIFIYLFFFFDAVCC